MEVKFDKLYLQELYETGKTTDRKHHFQPDVVKKYQVIINRLWINMYAPDRFTPVKF